MGSRSFFQNPMFAVTIRGNKTILQLRCSTAKTVAVNIMMLAVPTGTPLSKYRNAANGKPILDSGNYRHGFVVTEPKIVHEGTYVVIVSNWSSQGGEFTLCVGSSTENIGEVIPIP